METVLRVFQVFLAIGLIGVVLLQRSEGGGLGIGSSGGMGSFMSVRGTANLLTRVTAILAALFMSTCLALALIANPRQAPRSLFDAPASAPALPAGQIPAAPIPTPSQAPTGPAPESGSAPIPAAPPAPPAPNVQPPVSQAPVAPPPAAAAPVAPKAEAPTTTPAQPAVNAQPAVKKKKPTGAAAPHEQ